MFMNQPNEHCEWMPISFVNNFRSMFRNAVQLVAIESKKCSVCSNIRFVNAQVNVMIALSVFPSSDYVEVDTPFLLDAFDSIFFFTVSLFMCVRVYTIHYNNDPFDSSASFVLL